MTLPHLLPVSAPRFVLASFFVATPALAEEGAAPAPSEGTVTTTAAPSEAEPEKPKMDFSAPPPDAPLQRKAFIHEGFYFRVGVGPGFAATNVNDTSAANRDASGSSFAFSGDVLVGGMPSPGIALGGALLTNLAVSTNLTDAAGGSVGQGAQLHYLVGPFFDAYPNFREGFHLGAALGFAGATLGSPAGFPGHLVGGGGAAWLGYDFWVAPEWSTGLLLKGQGAYLAGPEDDGSTFGVSLLLTVLAN